VLKKDSREYVMDYRLVLVDRYLTPTDFTIFKKNYNISKIDKSYHIKNYKLEIDDFNNIVQIYIDDIHPNVDPETKKYCCPIPIEHMNLCYENYRAIEFIENQLLKKFYFDLSYFSWKHIKHILRYSIVSNFDSRIFYQIDQKYAYPKPSVCHPDPGSKKFKEIVNRDYN
jgi:hypothetical protein